MTVSSLKKNEATLDNIAKGSVTLTDIPGHDFSLDQMLAAYRGCKGVIFMIDSFDKTSFKSCAENLYELLSTHDAGNILVFCNKQDIPFAKKPMIIESELSTEIERLRKTKEHDLTDAKRNSIGREGKRFDFSHMEDVGIKITFAEGSVKVGQIDPILSFITNAI